MADAHTKIFLRKRVLKFEYITLILLFLPIISCNIITMKFKGTGKDQIYINPTQERPCPKSITVDGVFIPNPTCKYKFPNKIVTVEIHLDENIKSFYRMFSDIAGIIEVELTQCHSVENMAYLFENCNSLRFANLSNIDLSSVINIEGMFGNCRALKDLDLTNADLSKVRNHKNVFANCIQLRENSLLNKNHNLKRILQENTDLPETDYFCSIFNIFEITRVCKINTETANEDIIEGLKDSSYRKFLIEDMLNGKNETSTREGNQIFSITISRYDNVINLGSCEDNIRTYYNLTDAENLYIYKNIIYSLSQHTPSVTYEIFNNEVFIDMSIFENTAININLSNIIIYCDSIYDYFDEERICKINTTKAHENIIQGLNDISFREFLIYDVLNGKNEISTSEENQTFSILISSYDSIIDLSVCEENIRVKYGIHEADNLFIYKHEIYIPSFNIPLITFQVFDRNASFNMDVCKNDLIGFNIPVKINEQELFKYNPSDEYYSENCTDGDLSLYERKQEYNDGNLSLCQHNCTYINYNYNTRSVNCYCYPNQLDLETNTKLLHKFELKEEEKDKCKIIPSDNKESDMIIYCNNIYEYFYEARICKINITRANKDIIEGLNDSSFREYLINDVLYGKNESSTSEDNTKYSISTLRYDKTIDLGDCETIIKIQNNIAYNSSLYLYKHEMTIPMFNIPIITFSVFDGKHLFNMDYCQNILIGFNIPVKINEQELFKYNPSDEYYSENCTDGDLSLYERKQEYNDRNLSLCQSNCKFDKYDNYTKEVTCLCSQNKSNSNQQSDYLDKFELKDEDKYKCKIFETDNFKIMNEKFEQVISSFVANKTGKDKGVVFEDIIKGITNGSMDELIQQLVNNKQDFSIKVDGDTYHLSTIKQQFESQELSAVDLGDCEGKIREELGLGDQEILIFKVDHNVPGFKIPIIEYVLFTEDGRVNINLDICEGIQIDYYIPVNITGDQMYLYDPNNEFYNDKCNQHTSEGGTDMTLYDRKNEYNVQNMSLCENGCEFEGYNETTLKTKCNCPIKTERNFFEIDQDKLLNKFKNYKDMINIMIIKCYNLVFSGKGLKKNIGSYIMISIAAINGCLIAFFYTKGFASLKTTMKDVLNKSFKEKIVVAPPKKDKRKKKDKNRNKRKSVQVSNIDSHNDLNVKPTDMKVKRSKTTRKKPKEKKEENLEKDKEKETKEDEIIYLNNYELNNLSYDDALKYETRTYWQYYLALLKTKHLIIFTFYTNTDYNSRPLKILLFLISFALFYTVNALFFNDSTMHQIYEDEGAFNFLYQIPQILYSTIISTAIKMIISFLSLTEKDFIKLKSKKSKSLALQELGGILNKISKKSIVLFALSYLFVILFWYYLSCFCAVYKNTQVYLIKDTLISFATSLLYPFPINLIPGLLRFPALRNKKKCLYIISTLVAII